MLDEFTGEPAEFEVVDGVMRCSWQGRRPDLCIPIEIFRLNLKRANRAMDEWMERKDGKVVPFPCGRRSKR